MSRKNMKKTNNLDYMNEVTPEELKGLFFMDYTSKKPLHWVRESWIDTRDLAIHTATLDWSNVENFRVQSYEDLVQPVNEDGFTEDQCESRNIDFVPECQKIEYLFGDMYRIDRKGFEFYTDIEFGRGLDKGLYLGKETGLIITDTETTISPYGGSEDAFKNPKNSHILMDLSCQKVNLECVREILDDNGLDQGWGSMVLEEVLENALEDFCSAPDAYENQKVLNYIKELDEMHKVTAA